MALSINNDFNSNLNYSTRSIINYGKQSVIRDLDNVIQQNKLSKCEICLKINVKKLI